MASVLLPAVLSADMPTRLAYPETRKSDVVDDYFGTRIADPYRWLEDPNSAETQGVGRGAEQGDVRVPRSDSRRVSASGSG